MLFGKLVSTSGTRGTLGISGSDRSNVVWQYLYTMRLSKLKGLTEQDVQPPVDGPNDEMKRLKFASEKFVETIQKYRKQHLFWKEINIPEGMITSTITLDHVPGYTYTKGDKKWLGDIHCSVNFMPKMDPKPVIPLNLLQVIVSDFIDSMLKINPDLMDKPSIYPPDILNSYHFSFENVHIYPSQGVLHLRDYMDTPTYNLKLLSPNGFGGIMFSRSHLLNVYGLAPGDVPTFSDDYTSNISKLIKKAKTVFNALKKGTWKGHTYELQPAHDISKSFIIHQSRDNYNKTDKVIHPNFSVGCNIGYEIVDGIRNSPDESPLSEEERKEFSKFLKNRFNNFGISY